MNTKPTDRLNALLLFYITLSVGSSFFVFYYLFITTMAPNWVGICLIFSLVMAFWTSSVQNKINCLDAKEYKEEPPVKNL